MKLLNFRGLCLTLILVSLVLISCSSDPPPVVIESDVIVKVAYISSQPDTQDIINDNDTWDQAVLARIRYGLNEAYTDQFGAGTVKIKAVSDNEYVYISFNWQDSSQSIRPGYFTHQPTKTSAIFVQNSSAFGGEIDNLTSPLTTAEDVLGLIFDYGNNPAVGANCASMCHEVNLSDTMFVNAGNVDVWVWRAGRTDPLGLAEDQFWGANDSIRNDAADEEIYVSNGSGEPDFTHFDGPSHQSNFLYLDDIDSLHITEWFDSLSMGGVPGWLLNRDWNQGETSRYDVKAKSFYDSGSNSWTVVLWRKLDTGESDDLVFEVGNKYEATLTVMNHTNKMHSGSEPFEIQF